MREGIFVAGLVAALASTIPAQLSVSTTAQTFESSYPFGSTCSLPPGTTLTNPESCLGIFSQSVISRVEYQALNASDLTTIDFSGTTMAFSPSGTLAPPGQHVVDAVATVTSPVPILVDIWLLAGGDGEPGSTASISALGTTATYRTPTSFVGIRTVLDSNGIDIHALIDAQVAPGPGSAVSVRARIVPASVGFSYGTPCGSASLSYHASLDAPATIRATDPGSTTAVVLIGSQRMDTPLDQLVPFPWPCSLRTDITTAVPVPAGGFELPFLPPPGTVTLQLLSVLGTSLQTSNGLEFIW